MFSFYGVVKICTEYFLLNNILWSGKRFKIGIDQIKTLFDNNQCYMCETNSKYINQVLKIIFISLIMFYLSLCHELSGKKISSAISKCFIFETNYDR